MTILGVLVSVDGDLILTSKSVILHVIFSEPAFNHTVENLMEGSHWVGLYTMLYSFSLVEKLIITGPSKLADYEKSRHFGPIFRHV
jgi:predicted transposase YdaD